MLSTRIYDCNIFHSRNLPVKHAFSYRSFNFCIDLDEVESLSRHSIFFGLDRFKPFRFVPADSLFAGKNSTALDLKRAVISYAEEKGVQESIHRVEFLGNVRTFGYSYNPASFFFGYSHDQRVLFGIVEVTNTFKEKKAYFIPLQENSLISQQAKLFYVSPFTDLDSQFDFHLKAPEQKLFIQIDSVKASTDQTIKVHATLTGTSKPFQSSTLLKSLIHYPLVPLTVMFKIHFQALKLYLKGIPYLKKNSKNHLQKGGLS